MLTKLIENGGLSVRVFIAALSLALCNTAAEAHPDRTSGSTPPLFQNTNAFYGDEYPERTQAGATLRSQFFNECLPLPTNVDELLEETTLQRACASLVKLQCGAHTLAGYHLTRTVTKPVRFRVYTAAHVVNSHNRRLGNGGATGIFPFETCQLAFAKGGPPLDAEIGPLQVRTEAVRSFIASRGVSRRFGSDHSLSIADIAWFDVTPNGDSDLLYKASLPRYSGSLATLTRVCSAGSFGRGGTVARCVRHGISLRSDGTLGTRTPTVGGMSGGLFAAKIGEQNFALGVISAEWGGQDDAGLDMGTRGSLAIEFKPGRENVGIRY